MAEQAGDRPLKGRIGDLIYYRRKGKQCVRRAPKNVKRSAATKRSAEEFGVASAAGATLRKAFQEIIAPLQRYKLTTNRLNKLLFAIVQSGPTTQKGTKQLLNGNVGMLKTFEFSTFKSLTALIRVIPSIKIEPLKKLTLSVPPFDITQKIFGPPTSHYARILTTCCIAGFDIKDNYSTHTEELFIDLTTQQPFPGGSVEFDLTGADNCLVTLAVAITFHEENMLMSGDRKWIAGRIIYAKAIKKGRVVMFNNFKHKKINKNIAVKKVSGWKINK